MNFKGTALVFAAVIASLVPAHAASADGDCPTDEACLVVTVKGPTPSVTAITYSDLKTIHDLDDAPYRLRAPGEAPATHDGTVATGVSLNRLLNLSLNLDPSAVDRLNLTIPGRAASARTTPLGARQLGASVSNGYADGLMPALVLADGRIGYVRPLSATGTTDVNTTVDNWSGSAQVTRMTVWTSDERISGHVVATQSSVNPRTPVTFRVAFDGSPDTSDLTYKWNFCGDTSTAAAPTRSWKAPKKCTVSVAVKGLGVTGDIEPASIRVNGPTVLPNPDTTSEGSGSQGGSKKPTGPTLGFAHINDSDLEILRGSQVPESVGEPVLTQPLTPEQQVAAGPLTSVSGQFLEASNGEVPPVSTAIAPVAATVHRARPRSYAWMLYLLAPALITVGALVEMRPRQRRAG